MRKKAVPLARYIKGRTFLTVLDVMRILSASRSEVYALERTGELVPERGPADAREKRDRRYPVQAVCRLFYKRAGYSEENAALFQARVLELLEEGRSDVEVVRELSVPLELVERLRRAQSGPTVRKAAALEELEKSIDTQRASHARMLLARRSG